MACSIYEKLGEGLNSADLAVAKATGRIVGFTHRDQLPVPLYVTPLNVTQDANSIPIGNREADEIIQVLIPSQSPIWSGSSGFSGSWNVQPSYSGASNQPQEGDVMKMPWSDTENIYVVSGEIKKVNNENTYVVSFTKRRTTNLGEWS